MTINVRVSCDDGGEHSVSLDQARAMSGYAYSLSIRFRSKGPLDDTDSRSVRIEFELQRTGTARAPGAPETRVILVLAEPQPRGSLVAAPGPAECICGSIF